MMKTNLKLSMTPLGTPLPPPCSSLSFRHQCSMSAKDTVPDLLSSKTSNRVLMAVTNLGGRPSRARDWDDWSFILFAVIRDDQVLGHTNNCLPDVQWMGMKRMESRSTPIPRISPPWARKPVDPHILPHNYFRLLPPIQTKWLPPPQYRHPNCLLLIDFLHP